MTSTSRPTTGVAASARRHGPRGRGWLSVTGGASLAAGVALLLAGTALPSAEALTSSGAVRAPAQSPAADSPATNGQLDWGVKDSFRAYVEGPIADGVIEVSAPATRNADGTFRFADGSGVVDPAAGTATLDFGGEVYFEGHGEGDTAALRMWLADPRLVIAAGTGTLVADLKSGEGSEIIEDPDVPFATLDLDGQSLRPDPDGTLALDGIAATLTAEGAPAFGGFYEPGEALDPVAFTVTVDSGPTPTATPTTTPTSTPTTSPSTSPTSQPPTTPPTSTPTETTSAPTAPPVPTPSPSATWDEGEISSGLLDWGFKTSFLSYISGGIANGGWTTSGVSEVNGGFRWTAAYGDYDLDAGTGRASFTGKVRFTGHDGALDLTISRPQVRFDGGDNAVLLLDVLSKSLESEELVEQQAVEFAVLDLGAARADIDDDGVSYAAVPATLTSAGAIGFGGFYEAGTELDPVTVVFGVGGAEVPGGGSAGGPGGGLAGTGASPWLLGSGALLVVVGAATVAIARRRGGGLHAAV